MIEDIYNEDTGEFMDDYDDNDRIKLDDPEAMDIQLDDTSFEDDFDDDDEFLVMKGATPLQKITNQLKFKEYQRKPMRFKVIGTREICDGVPMVLGGKEKCAFKLINKNDKLQLFKLSDIMFIDEN